MRKITREAIDCFLKRKRFTKSNTKVRSLSDGTFVLLLFNNKIAYLYPDNSLAIDSCGYNTVTTRERLNGLNNVHVQKIKGDLVLNKKFWDGNIISIL